MKSYTFISWMFYSLLPKCSQLSSLFWRQCFSYYKMTSVYPRNVSYLEFCGAGIIISPTPTLVLLVAGLLGSIAFNFVFYSASKFDVRNSSLPIE